MHFVFTSTPSELIFDLNADWITDLVNYIYLETHGSDFSHCALYC